MGKLVFLINGREFNCAGCAKEAYRRIVLRGNPHNVRRQLRVARGMKSVPRPMTRKITYARPSTRQLGSRPRTSKMVRRPVAPVRRALRPIKSVKSIKPIRRPPVRSREQINRARRYTTVSRIYAYRKPIIARRNMISCRYKQVASNRPIIRHTKQQ